MWRPVTKEELMHYVDGHLSRAREEAVAIHLEANPHEARRVADYCRQNELLAELGDAIARELPRAGEERLKRLVAMHVVRARRRRGGMVAAALLVAVVTGFATIQMIHGSREITALAGASAGMAHAQPTALSSAAR